VPRGVMSHVLPGKRFRGGVAYGGEKEKEGGERKREREEEWGETID